MGCELCDLQNRDTSLDDGDGDVGVSPWALRGYLGTLALGEGHIIFHLPRKPA